MKNYFLTLAGLRTALRTPYEITISENLRPFLCEGHEQIDCAIELQSCTELPAFSENGVWHGLEYYDSTQDAMRIFHCKVPLRRPLLLRNFMKTEISRSGSCRMLYLISWVHPGSLTV